MKGGGGGVSWAKTDTKLELFLDDFQLKILTAYDYLGQWTHWLILVSRLDQELYAI